MKLTRSGTGRDGFTLVELMIAAAITVMIMTILSICFQTSMSAMSSMRAQGDAADQLRALNTVMKRDFQANRHLPIEGAINRGCRLSDYFAGARPSSGFTLIHSPPSIKEGDDGAFDSFRHIFERGGRGRLLPGAIGSDGQRIEPSSVQPLPQATAGGDRQPTPSVVAIGS